MAFVNIHLLTKQHRYLIMKNSIPKKFHNGDSQPKANTVGELKAILAQLPDDLSFSNNSEEKPVTVSVCNINSNVHVTIEAE